KNVVLSRREVIEKERSEKRQKFLDSVNVGDRVAGTVKNITDFGAFIDLDGMDGLLHVTDMTWGRLGHPSELLKVGQQLEVVVLDINKEKERVSLGLKQTQKNPWDQIEERFPAGQRIDGMIHVSDLSWTRKINHPSETFKKGDEVEAAVIDIDKVNQRISLGVKQLTDDPWKTIDEKYKIGDLVKGKVTKLASFGAFVQLQDDIDGLVHISQLSEDHVAKVKDVLKVGQEVEARVIK